MIDLITGDIRWTIQGWTDFKNLDEKTLILILYVVTSTSPFLAGRGGGAVSHAPSGLQKTNFLPLENLYSSSLRQTMNSD